MRINGRAKGASGERELAELLRMWALSAGVKISPLRNLEQVRGGGHDLIGLEEFGLAVEVKRVENLAIPVWWRQAVRQADALGLTPVLAWRQNRKPWKFRVRGFVYPCETQLCFDLEDLQFKQWFLSKVMNGRVENNV